MRKSVDCMLVNFMARVCVSDVYLNFVYSFRLIALCLEFLVLIGLYLKARVFCVCSVLAKIGFSSVTIPVH